MFHHVKAVLITLVVLSLGSGLRATDFDLGKSGKLSALVAFGWTAKSRPLADTGIELTFTPTNQANAKAVVTVFTPKTPPPPATNAELDRNFTALCRKYVPASVERTVTLKHYTLIKGHGAYALFTDSALVGIPPKPGDYKVMAPGFIKLSESIQLIVTLYADSADGPELAAMISTVESFHLTATQP